MDEATSGQCGQREIDGEQQRHLCRRNSEGSEPCDKDGIKLHKGNLLKPLKVDNFLSHSSSKDA